MSEYGWTTTGSGRKVYRRLDRDREPQRSGFPRPFVRADGMDAVINPIDGRPYESRSEYERVVKEHGCEIVGDDKGHWTPKTQEYKPEGVKQDIVDAMKEQGAL